MVLKTILVVLGTVLFLVGIVALAFNGYTNESGDEPARTVPLALAFFAAGLALVIGGAAGLDHERKKRLLVTAVVAVLVFPVAAFLAALLEAIFP
jgi:uncharacterized membrane protein